MTSGTPWSVKGIDPRARAIAKTAARREGLTLGEWLNRVILDDDTPAKDWEERLGGFPGFPASPAGDGGDGDGDLSELIARLGARIEAAEARAQLAISGVDQSVSGLARRLERVEESLEEEEEQVSDALARTRAAQDELIERIRKLERSGPGGDSNQVRVVENALGKIAARLYETERDFRAEIDGLLDREERRKDGSEKAIKSLAQRLEEEERRARGEEASIKEILEQRARETKENLDGLYDNSRALQRRLVAAETATHQAAEALARSHERLEARLAGLETGTRGAVTEEQFQRRFDRLATELAEVIRDTRREFAGQIEQLGRHGGQGARFEQALQATEARLAAAETRQADTLARIGQEVARLARAMDRRFSENETRLDERFREEDRRRSHQRERADIEARLDEVRKESHQAVRQIGEQVARLGENLAERVNQAEQRSAAALEAAGDRMARVVETLDSNGRARSEDEVLQARIAASEERTAQRIAEAMKGVHERLDAARHETAEALSPVQRAMTALAERLETIEHNSLREPPRRTPFQPTGEARRPAAPLPASAPATDDDADSFNTPLQPPPGVRAAALKGEFDISSAPDSFVVAVDSALDAVPARQRPVEAEPAPAEDLWSEAPQPAPLPDPRERARPRQAPNLGATADADFLAAARSKIRAGGSDPARFDYAAPQTRKEGTRGRLLLAGVSLLGFLALGAAAAFILMDGFGRTPATTQAEVSSEALSTLFADVRTEASAAAEPAEEAPAPAEEAEPLPEPQAVTTQPIATQTPAPAPAPATSAPASATPASNTVADTPVTLEAAATAGDPVARYQLALQRINAGDLQGGATLMRRAAEQGVPDAQFRYGRMLERGEGVATDPSAARDWTLRAAEAGHLRAMYEAGVMFINLSPTPANQQAAARWFEQAALHGMGDSQFNLGLLFEEGFGVPQSPADAYAWFLIAAAGGDTAARERASGLRQSLSADERAAAEEAAASFAPRMLDPLVQGRYPPQAWETGTSARLVARAQELLAASGFDAGPADGAYGQRTREAIIAYQRAEGLEASGAVDSALIARLERAQPR